MALTEKLEYAAVQHGLAAFAIKQYTVISRDGVVISRSNPLTRAVNPGDDISMYPAEIQGMCNGYWTPEVITAYQDMMAAQEAEMNQPA